MSQPGTSDNSTDNAVIDYMKAKGLNMTRANYELLAYLGNVPEDAEYPLEITDAPPRPDPSPRVARILSQVRNKR